jgi:hypothetical protein
MNNMDKVAENDTIRDRDTLAALGSGDKQMSPSDVGSVSMWLEHCKNRVGCPHARQKRCTGSLQSVPMSQDIDCKDGRRSASVCRTFGV